MDSNWQYIIGIIVMIYSSPLFYDIVKKYINTKFPGKEEKKIELESTKLSSESRRADAETITERAMADKTYIESMGLAMDQQKRLFDDRIELLEKRTSENIELAEKRQLEITAMLNIMKLENEQIKAESQKIKSENWELHQENLKLVGVIGKLQQAIKGLKKLIEKLMSGINKLISTYEQNHKDEMIPWKPILTEDEQLLFQSDFDFKDLKSYKE